MSLILSMILFSLSMSITPGPVNFITLSSGVNYGFRNTMPFVSGATIGFILLLLGVGLSLSMVSSMLPSLLKILQYSGSAFIAYMGYSMIQTKVKLKSSKTLQPTFIQGFLLQWLNPKAWMACIAGISAFNLANSFHQLILFVIIYFIICYICIALWALAGDKIKDWLNNDKNMNIFNRLMGASLIIIAVFLLISA
ncbi:MAG: LysE family translocator [Alcanivoracaceae bacterium]|nr:LysE family translocator [Alcanivoracaceae bacterium]